MDNMDRTIRIRAGVRMLALIFAGWLMVWPGRAHAQPRAGAVAGKVKDATGAVLPGTILELTNVANGAIRSQVAEAAGEYRFEAVTAGSYKLQAAHTGFRTVAQFVAVEAGGTSWADFTLAVNTPAHEIVVTTPQQSASGTQTDLVLTAESRVLTDLPGMSRDAAGLVEMMPGVRLEGGGTVAGSLAVDLAGNFALGNGTRRSQSLFYVDGAENMGAWRNQAFQMPNMDSIQEIQITTSGASAEFGKEPGVRMNVITRSGTKEFHGTAFLAGHATGLNANTWSANLNHRARPTDVQKWLGGSLGGPVRKNRSFFFASYQHFYSSDPSQLSAVRMPTPAMITGDFSAINGFSIKALDPATGKAIGKVIPARLLNPIAVLMTSRFPTIPQYSNDPAQGRFFWQFKRPARNDEWLGRVDHQLTRRHQLSGMYLGVDGGQTRPDGLAGSINSVPGWGGDTETAVRQHTLSIRHYWVWRSNLVLENRAALARQSSTRRRSLTGEDLGTLGGTWPAVSPGIAKTLPAVILSGGPSAIGGASLGVLQQNFRAFSTANWMKGKHNIKFGAEVQHVQYSRLVDYDNGQLRFTGAYANTGASVNGPWPTLSTPSGDNQFALAWADFLMGRVRTFQATGAADAAYGGRSYFFFVQDQFKLTPKFTIGMGLRYELYGAQTSDSILAGYLAGHKSDQFANAPAGLAFSGDQGIPGGMRNPDRNNVAPRLGFAWDLFGDGSTVIRSGGGVYYAYPPLSIVEQLAAIVASPTLSGSNAYLSNPWGTAHTNSGDIALQYPGGMPSFDPNPAKRNWQPSAIMGFNPDVSTPYQWQFNVGLQRQVVRGMTVMAAYLGNRGRKGWSVRDNNLALWAANAGTGNVDARRPIQSWRAINLISTDMNEGYDAAELSMTLNRKSCSGRVTYTLRRFLTSAASDAQEVGVDNSAAAWAANPRNVRGDIASVVSRQQLRAYVTYLLPALTRKRWLSAALNGWQVSGSANWSDGDRLNVILGSDYNFDGFTGDRPDQIGPIRYVKSRQGSVTTWIDRSAFANPPAPDASRPYSFGTLPRAAVRGPNRLTVGAAVMKNITFKDRRKLQLRADASNVLNHPNLSNPVMDLSRSDFGQILTKDGGGRVLQMHAKFYF
jgi:hypothetical protein